MALAGLLTASPLLDESAHATPVTLQAWRTTTDDTSALTPQSNITLGSVAAAVNDSLSYQAMSGFGAAFTDSSTYLMKQLKGFSTSS